jgi:predicted metal-dependent peptidase
MASLTVEQKIERAHVSIMQSKLFRFYSGLTMIGKVEVTDKIPTAGTNGRDVWYGREFMAGLNNKQVLFVVLHELSHIAWRHTTTWKYLYDKDKVLANCACDFVINLQLLDQDPNGREIEFPTDENGERIGLVDEKYRGMDAQQVFDLLRKEYGDKEGSGKGDGDGEGGNGRDFLKSNQFDEHDFESAEGMTEAEKQELGTRVQQALHQGKQLAGKMGGEVPRGLEELVAPQISWQETLRDMVKVVCKGSGDSSWRKFSRKFLGMDIYLPINIDHKVGRILVGVDTSGSIGGAILDAFMAEVKSICDEVRPEGLDLLYWDWNVAGHEFYADTEYEGMLQSTKPVGGGGTDPNCVVKYMKENTMLPEIVIVLTDGYFGDMNAYADLSMPVIWCVIDNPSYVATTGKVIHIKS